MGPIKKMGPPAHLLPQDGDEAIRRARKFARKKAQRDGLISPDD